MDVEFQKLLEVLAPGGKVPFNATVRYIRPEIIKELRLAAKKMKNGPRQTLVLEAASEIEELRTFIGKQTQMVTRLLSEVTKV